VGPGAAGSCWGLAWEAAGRVGPGAGEGAGLGPFLALLGENTDLVTSEPRVCVSAGCVQGWFPL